MSDKPKKNGCRVFFFCNHNWDSCAYHTGGHKCEFVDEYAILDHIDCCVSSVAQVNAMVLKLKELGINVKEISDDKAQ